MKRSFFASLVLILIVSTVSSCKFIVGEGPVTEKDFDLESFRSVELDGSFDVQITQGAEQKVLVVGNQNIIENLEMKVVNDMLYLSLEPGNYLDYDLEVRLTVPTIEDVRLLGSGDIKVGTFVQLQDLKIVLDGSGDIKSEGVLESSGKMDVVLEGSGDIDLKLKANHLKVELEGSGDIDLSGTATSLVAALDGSGDIKAYGLESVECEASLDGSGSIHVFVSKHLKATLDGSGDIVYKGNPTVDEEVDGSGSISAH